MTTDLPPSAPRPSLRPVGSGLSRSISRNSVPQLQQPPRSVPQHAFVDLTDSASATNDFLGPSSKRQKLDGDRQAEAFSTTSARKDDEHTHTLDSKRLQAQDSIDFSSVSGQPRSGNAAHSAPPFPTRPVFSKGGKLEVSGWPQVHEKRASRGEVQVKPYVLSSPGDAPRYDKNEPSDFFPWAGNHPEDILSEQAAKFGYYDKPQGSQTETNTARPSVWTSLKHKSGLQILSSLYASVLDQRQAHGTVTADCTFKPPPRVTLTDTKREAWLRDLANSNIPLRRLSRTIPHGIRGKVLLDHCLSKSIPVVRAVWLAKCVGANEIRAFKRKGASATFSVGGETKWIKEWTSNVEQFVESIIAACGSSDWNAKMTYSLQLVTHLYSDNLLDKDQYLNWIVSSLHESSLDSVPMWLLTLRIHWDDLLQFRRRGRHLAAALLQQLQKIKQNASCEDIYAPLRQQLVSLIRSFAMSSPFCFILVDWFRYKPFLQSCVDQSDTAFKGCLERLTKRNLRFARETSQRIADSELTPPQKMIAFLDNTSATSNIRALSESCRKTIEDSGSLIATLLEWASTIYREGIARIYTAVRLLRIWSKSGVGLDQPILAFLASKTGTCDIQPASICKVLNELVRSKSFSIGKYLQWLMARGALPYHEDSAKHNPYEVQFLKEMPLHGLPEHVLNLRKILMHKMGFTLSEERDIMVASRKFVSRKVPNFFPETEPESNNAIPTIKLEQLSGGVKYDLSRWIRQSLLERSQSLATPDPSNKQTQEKSSRAPTITVQQFQIIRSLLLDIEDYSILADVLNIVSDSDDIALLSAIPETVTHHFDTFMAIGAAPELFRTTVQRLAEKRSGKSTERALVASLIDLAERLPSNKQVLRALRQEQALHEPKMVTAAYSPVSDHTEPLQNTGANFVEELEQRMSVGTSMDKQTLSRFFNTITSRLETLSTDKDRSWVGCFDLLARLRSFDMETFEKLVTSWIERMLRSSHRPCVRAILSQIVCTGCATLRKIVDQMANFSKDPANAKYRYTVALDTVILLIRVELSHHGSNDKTHKYIIEQQRTLRNSATPILTTVCTAIEACSTVDESTRVTAVVLISDRGFSTLVQSLLTSHEAVFELGATFAAASKVVEVRHVLDHIVDPTSSYSISHLGVSEQLAKIVNVASDFNLPFCQLKIKAVLDNYPMVSKDYSPSLDDVLSAWMKEAVSSVQCRPGVWVRLVSVLSQKNLGLVHDNAAYELLSIIPDWPTLCHDSSLIDLERYRQPADVLIAIVEATEHSLQDDGAFSMILAVADSITKLQQHSHILTFSTHPPSPKPLPLAPFVTAATTTHSDNQLCSLFFWVSLILRLLTSHSRFLSHPKFPQQTLIHIILSLSNLLISQHLSAHPSLLSYTTDALILLSDHLSDDTRAHCIRYLRDEVRTRDRRLQFILGYEDEVEGEWLQLVSPAPPSSSASAPSSTIQPSGSADEESTKENGYIRRPFPLKRWEMVQDATPVMGENDTSVSLSLFGARKSVL